MERGAGVVVDTIPVVVDSHGPQPFFGLDLLYHSRCNTLKEISLCYKLVRLFTPYLDWLGVFVEHKTDLPIRNYSLMVERRVSQACMRTFEGPIFISV